VKPERITLKSIRNDILEILNLEKGLFYTFRELLLRPRKAVNTYLYEDRTKLYNPFRYVFFGTAFLVVAYSLVIENLRATDNALIESFNDPALNASAQVALELVLKNINIVTLISIPGYALCAWKLFTSENKNYAEHLAIASYAVGQTTWVTLIFILPSLIFYNDIMTSIASLATFVYPFIIYKQIFNLGILKSILSVIFITIVTSIITISLVLMTILVIYAFHLYPTPITS